VWSKLRQISMFDL